MGRIQGVAWGYVALGILLATMLPAVPTGGSQWTDGRLAGDSVSFAADPLRGTARITLEPSVACFHAPAPNYITISIWVHDLPQVIQGGQFFLAYDNTVLDFVSADPAPTVFTLQVYESVNETAGTIDYATGVPLGPPNTMPYPDHIMAVLKFQLVAGHGSVCNTANLVWFRSNSPPTRLTTTTSPLVVPTFDLGSISIDNTPPAFSPPASNLTVACDGSGNTTQFNNWLNNHGGAMATDTCDSIVWTNDYNVSHWVIGAGTSYVQVTFTATDGCGNSASTTAKFTIVDATLGDLNCDCALTVADIAPFVQALTDPAAYLAAHPTCNIYLGDMNGDTYVDGADIQGFVTALITGG